MYRKLIPLLLFCRERILQSAVVFESVVVQAVYQITRTKQMRIQVSRRHATQFYPEFLHTVVAQDRIDRANVERVVLLSQRYKPREYQVNQLFSPVIQRNLSQSRNHFLHILRLAAVTTVIHAAVLSPEFRILAHCIFSLYYWLLMRKRLTVNIVVEFVTGVEHLSSAVNTVYKVIQLQLGSDTFVGQQSGVFAVPVKLLLHIHVLHKVQVNVVWHIHLNPFHEMRRIHCYVQVACETK